MGLCSELFSQEHSPRLTVMSNKKLSTKENSELIDAFNLFDADKDKRINAEEILGLIRSLGGQSDCSHVKELVRACQQHRDQSLGMEEFLDQWRIFKQKLDEEDEDEEEIREAFKSYDQDGDGYITRDEMFNAITQMGFVRNCEEEANKCMDEMDLDKDGKVSYAEFVLRWRVS